MAAIPPITHIQGLFGSSYGKEIQAVLDSHCNDYPKSIPVGCNLVVMQENSKPALFTAGKILPNGPQNWGSTSKQFTAACIDKLVKRGAFKYNDDCAADKKLDRKSMGISNFLC